MYVPQILMTSDGENMTAVDIEPQNSECGTGAAKESSLRGLRHLERDQWLDVTIGIFSCTKCTWTTGRIPFQVWMLITHRSRSRVNATKPTDFPMVRLEDSQGKAEMDDGQGT